MRVASLVFGVGILLAVAERADGLSGFIPLTPSNIHSSYSFILVKSSTYEDEANIRHFRVIVRPTETIDPTNFHGALSILDASSNVVASSAVVSQHLPWRSDEVPAALRERAVVFEFKVASQYLENSKFHAYDQPAGIPSFTGYWFHLRDYAGLEAKTGQDDLAAAQSHGKAYRELLELKYDAPIKWLEVISFSPTTKILWFDWERKWWGSLTVVETTEDGRPMYWYDIPESPSAQSLESIRVVTLSGQKHLEVIDCTHMGNGMLYLYEIRTGFVRLKLKVRVMTNLLGVRFEPRIAHLEYRDIDGDGNDDVVVNAEWIDRERLGDSEVRGAYQRVYYYRDNSFQEDRDKQKGRAELFD